MSDAKPQGRPAAKVQRRLRRDEALIEMVRAERVLLASRRLTKGPEEFRKARVDRSAEGEEMSAVPNARSIADAMAANAAGYVLIAPPEHRDAATASVAEGFRDACVDHGIPIDAGDMAYYVQVVTAKVAEITPRLVELGLKAKK